MTERFLQTFTDALNKAAIQADTYGYKDPLVLPCHKSGMITTLVENFQKFEESFTEYSRRECLAKVIQDGKVDITERDVADVISHTKNLLEIYRGVISNNYKIIKNLQKAACPSKLQIPEEKRLEFSRGMKEIITLSLAVDKLDTVVTQLQQRGHSSDMTDNTMTNIFDEALTIFNTLSHNIEIISHTTDGLLHSSDSSPL